MTPKLLELPRAGPLRVQITEDLLRELWQAATHNPNVEVGGFMLGHVYPLGHSAYHLVLTRYLPIEDTKATEREFTFRAEAFVRLDHEYPIARGQTPTGLTCLGWFHTHPGHGVFFGQWLSDWTGGGSPTAAGRPFLLAGPRHFGAHSDGRHPDTV